MTNFPLGVPASLLGGISELTEHASVDEYQINANPTVLTLPATIEEGDLLLFTGQGVGSAADVTFTPYSGWTTIAETGNSTFSLAAAAYKIADGTEGGATFGNPFGNTSSSSEQRFLMVNVFRANVPITSVTSQDEAQEITYGNPAAQTVNASGGATPLLVWCLYQSDVGKSFVPTQDGSVTHSQTSYYQVRWKFYSSSPADVTVDVGDTAANINVLMSGYLELST